MIIDVEQGGKDWLTMRCAMCTGSRVTDVVTKLKNGSYSAARKNYLMELVVARLTGLSADNYVSPAMQWGLDNEQFAVAAYEMQNDVMVDPAGFAIHPKMKWFGASADRLIGKTGVFEAKCPTSATHLAYLLDGKVPVEYMPQMLAEMACYEREFADFVSWDPRYPKHMRLFVRRFERDDKLIGIMEQEVEIFLGEVEAMLEQIQKGYAPAPELNPVASFGGIVP